MKTFQEFMSLCEVRGTHERPSGAGGTIANKLGWGGGASTTRTGEGGRIGKERKKSAPERRRMKAVGGGKMEPVEYKPRKDIGKAKGSQTQAPEQERGSARERQLAAAKEERRKAAQARAAAKKSGGTAPTAEKPKAKEIAKAATKLLSKKKETKPVSPNYKPQKASGLSAKERVKVTRSGERMLRGIMKDQETEKYKKATGEAPKGKAKTKILGYVEKRMAN